jgi:VanZ family protein
MWRWWIAVAVIVAGAGCLTLLAYREGLPEIFQRIPQFDKVVHFTIGGLLALFLDGALRQRTAFTLAGFAIPLAALVVLVPAGIEEYLQRYSAHRTSSIWDFVADLLGVVVLLSLSRRVRRARRVRPAQ